ncbi:MAG: hypothetical protein IJK98_09795 [Clostridia bacterium]|nr:hypothetical protein [Clostridia bacterium]
MKKRFSLFILSVMVLLSGCGLRPAELSRRLIIEAIGVDRTDAGFSVTVQALDSLAVGIDVGVPDSGVTKCYTFDGTTVEEAFRQVGQQTGLSPLYSQTRLLAVGYPTARDGLTDALAFFLREQTARADLLFAVAEHTAQELVTASFGKNRVGADVLEDAIRSGEETGATLGTPLYAFLNLLYGETDAADCPLLGVRENPLSGDSLALPLGSVVFRGDRAATVIPAEEVLFLRLLTGRTDRASLTVPLAEGRCALRLTKAQTTVTRTGDLSFRVGLRVRCDIAEVSGMAAEGLTPEAIRQIARAASGRITRGTAGALDRCFYQNGCDVCRFFKRLRLLRPIRYRALPANLSPSDVTCEIECSVRVDRTGKEVLRQ